MVNQSEFSNWPLHEGILWSITMDWKSKTCVVSVSVFLNPGERSVPCTIVWSEVKAVDISHKSPLGNSKFIDKQWMDDRGAYIIQMQSGDELWVEAREVAFERTVVVDGVSNLN